MTDPSTASLRSFVTVAEHLHFGEAARRLYITTSALSQQISKLERQLGADLFVRSSRAVMLTAAGSELLPLAQGVLDANARISTWAERLLVRELRIGFTHVGPPHLIGEALVRATRTFPDTNLSFHKIHRDAIVESLESSELDVVFTWGPFHASGLQATELCTAPRSLLVNTSWVEADMLSVAIPDIDGPLVIFSTVDEAFTDWELTRNAGSGQRGPRVRDIEEALPFVAMGLAACVAPTPVAHSINHANIGVVPVIGVDPYPYIVCARATDTRSLIKRFVDLIPRE